VTKQRTKRRRRARNFAPWLVVGGLIGVGLLWSLRGNRSGDGADGSPEPIGRLRTQDFHSLAFSPLEPETVYFGHHGGLLVSKDGGRSWVATPLQNADAMALAIPPSDPQIIFAAGHNVFFKSADAGRTWSQVLTDLPGLDIHGFAADPENASRVFAHVVGFGVFESRNGGEHWELLNSGIALLNLAMGESRETLYGTAGQNGFWKSPDGGKTWSRLAGLPGQGAIAVAFDHALGRLYVTTLGEGAGLYGSEDQGETWIPLGLKGVLLAIAVRPNDPQQLVAVDEAGSVYASRDGGETW